MEITPQDLGEKWRVALLQRRALTRVRRKLGHVGATGDATYSTDKRQRPKKLRKFWLKSANLPEPEEAQVATVLSPENVGTSLRLQLVGTFGVTILMWAALMIAASFFAYRISGIGNPDASYTLLSILAPFVWLGWANQRHYLAPRSALRRINTDAVTREEIEAFLPTARGELDRTYLNTVLEAMHQPVPSTNGAKDIRSALRALGDTISVLPGEALPVNADDPAALRQSATETRHRAHQQTDSLLQASLLRQAEAEERQAEIVEQSGTAAKRVRARHSEATTHLNVLRSVLVAFGSAEASARMEQSNLLAETVKRVAGEATATAQAKRELDDMELASLYGQPLPVPQPQVVGIGKASVTSPPAPPAPTGKWWNNTSGGNGNAA